MGNCRRLKVIGCGSGMKTVMLAHDLDLRDVLATAEWQRAEFHQQQAVT